MTKYIVEIDNVSFSYNKRSPILTNISLKLHKGEIATLIGTSGSGKSTLFKLMTGMLSPQQGSIVIAQQTVPDCHLNVSYMMQEDLLLPWRNILRNMTLSTELGKKPNYHKVLDIEARKLLQELGLQGCEEKHPHHLSGGMRQRVSLARALLQKRPMLLLDEPFNSLDVCLREQMYLLLREVREVHGTTMLMVTHDFRDALALSDRIFLLKKGSIHQEWSIPETSRKDPYVSGLILDHMRASIIDN